MRGKKVSACVDNNSAKESLLGSSPKFALAAASLAFWAEASELGVKPWVSRIPSAQNLSDYLTRHAKFEFLMREFPSLLAMRDIEGADLSFAKALLRLENIPYADELRSALGDESDLEADVRSDFSEAEGGRGAQSNESDDVPRDSTHGLPSGHLHQLRHPPHPHGSGFRVQGLGFRV